MYVAKAQFLKCLVFLDVFDDFEFESRTNFKLPNTIGMFRIFKN